MSPVRVLALACLGAVPVVAQQVGGKADLTARIVHDPFAFVETMKVQPPVKGGRAWTVVDSITGKPVAGATVLYTSRDSARDEAFVRSLHPRFPKGHQHLHDLVKSCRFGKRYVSDRNGRVVVPIGSWQTSVTAVFRGRLGWRGAWGDGVEVKLGVTRWLAVHVTDARGQPVPRVALSAGPSGSWSAGRYPVATDKTGLGFVSVQANPRDPFSVTAKTFTRERVQKRFEPAELANIPKPIPLRLPATGTVLVTVVDEKGRPRNDVHRVTMTGSFSWSRQATRAKKTGAVFRHVGLGLKKLKFGVELVGVHGVVWGSGAGPVRAGTVAEIKVVTKGLIETRLQWADGKPFRNRLVDVEVVRILPPFKPGDPVWGMMPSLPSFQGTTDDDGYVRYFYKLWDRDYEKASFRVVTWVNRRSSTPTPEHYGRKAFKLRSPDLATVLIRRVPIAVSGVVVDETGAPKPRVFLRGPSRSQAISDEEGRFELRGIPGDGSEFVSAQVRGYLRYSKHFKFGTTDARVQLERAAKVVGSFRGPIPSTSYRPRIELVNASGKRPDRASFSLTSGQKIEGEFFPSGTYTFEVWLHSTVVHRIRDIELVAGETCTDPRLQNIPWETFLRRVRIRVQDSEGKPLPKTRVVHWRVFDKLGMSGARGETDAKGEFTFWIPKHEQRVFLETADDRWVRVENVTGDRTVVVPPRDELVVELAKLPELPPGFRLEAWWQFEDAPGQSHDPWFLPRYVLRTPSGHAPFRGVRCVLPLPGDARFRIEVRVRRWIDGKPGPRTEVVAGLGEVVRSQTSLKLPFTAQAAAGVDAAVRALRRR